MVDSHYAYSMLLLGKDGKNLGQFALSNIDWEPAVEWCVFERIRRGECSLSDISDGSVVQPVWHKQLGRPYVKGVQICISGNGKNAGAEISNQYFHQQARRVVLEKIPEGGSQVSKESYKYLITAHPSSSPPLSRSAGSLSIEMQRPDYPFRKTRLSEYARQARWFQAVEEPEAFPVFVPQEIMDEMIETTHQAGAKETGGILIGYLHRDETVPEIFAEVTCQIHAQHTRSGLTQLTFTAETWSDVEAARKIRGRDEILLGWWHSHSYMKEICKNCVRLKEGTCAASADFFSTDDYYVHRTCFPHAYSIALVISDSPCSGTTARLFGWRYGQIFSRGFYVFPENHAET